MKLLIALHDVTPAFEPELRALWVMCAEQNIVPALFVVPNWHGDWPLEDHGRFVSWLRARAREGSDVFLHGERHDEIGTRRRWHDHLRAFGRTDSEGEFLALDRDETRRRITRGAERLRDIGLQPIGFVAPAWLWSDGTRGTVGELGFSLSEDERAIYLHRRGIGLASPLIRWSARTSVRALASTAVARAMTWWHRHNWLVRIALHPSDMSRLETRQSTKETIAWWRARRHPWQYSAL